MLLNDTCAKGALQEFRLNRQAPGISHLLFVDDSLLFFKGSIDQTSATKSIITSYEKGTRQLLSLDKCSMMFGKKMQFGESSCLVILKIMVEGFEDRDLGLPV